MRRILFIPLVSFAFIYLHQQPIIAKNANNYSDANINIYKSKGKTKPLPKVKFKIITGIIQEGGSIIPVARTTFEIRKFSSTEIKKLIEKDKEKTKPTYENLSLIYASECEQKIGSPAQKKLFFRRCVNSKLDVEMNKWKKEVDSEFNIQLEKKFKQFPETIFVKTDLSGQAVVELNPGIWYINGSYSYLQQKSNIFWDVKVEVKPGLDKIELSNDNGEIINLK